MQDRHVKRIIGVAGFVWFSINQFSVAQSWHDDFTDGNPTDGVPVTWTVFETAQGTYNVSGGDYVAMGDNPSVGSQVMSSHVRNVMFQDVSVQTQAMVTESGAFAVTARSGDPNAFTGYGGSLNSNGFLAIFRTDGDILNPATPLVILSSTNIGLNASAEVKLQFDVIGSSLSLTAWKEDEPKPAVPQLTAADTMYSRGWAGVAFQEAASDPDAFATFCYVQAIAISAPPGDHNNDGIVDAADYVVWRKGLGASYTQGDYNIWRAHFGQTAGSGAALRAAQPLSAGIPEPAASLMLLTATLTQCLCRAMVAVTRTIQGECRSERLFADCCK